LRVANTIFKKMHQINIFKIIKNYKKNINKEPIEIVERKGLGHPDTLADLIAENFSKNYEFTNYNFSFI